MPPPVIIEAVDIETKFDCCLLREARTKVNAINSMIF